MRSDLIIRFTLTVILLSFPLSLIAQGDCNSNSIPDSQESDTDSDGLIDACDNCTLASNGDQLDTDNDGFGNMCDADLNNSGFVNFGDLADFKTAFNTDDPHADFNGSGFVNFGDLAIFKALFNSTPGPAGIFPSLDGSALFQEKCTGCHGTDGMGGINDAPSLHGCSVCDSIVNLFNKIEPDMPKDNPSSCVGNCAVAVAEFVFNSFNATPTPTLSEFSNYTGVYDFDTESVAYTCDDGSSGTIDPLSYAYNVYTEGSALQIELLDLGLGVSGGTLGSSIAEGEQTTTGSFLLYQQVLFINMTFDYSLEGHVDTNGWSGNLNYIVSDPGPSVCNYSTMFTGTKLSSTPLTELKGSELKGSNLFNLNKFTNK